MFVSQHRKLHGSPSFLCILICSIFNLNKKNNILFDTSTPRLAITALFHGWPNRILQHGLRVLVVFSVYEQLVDRKVGHIVPQHGCSAPLPLSRLLIFSFTHGWLSFFYNYWSAHRFFHCCLLFTSRLALFFFD